LVILVIFSLVTGWMFSGWPRIWEKPQIPPEVQEAQAADTTVYIVNAASTTWTVPANWSASNTIEVIGAGGAGDSQNTVGNGGGGGGAYAKIINLWLVPGSIATTQVGVLGSYNGNAAGSAGTDTFFNRRTGASTTCYASVMSVCAKGGAGGNGITGGAGGASSTSVGSTTFKGGDGGKGNADSDTGGGGGGAAGPLGDGKNGASSTAGTWGGGGGGGGGNSATPGVLNSAWGGNGWGGSGGGATGTNATANTAGGGGGSTSTTWVDGSGYGATSSSWGGSTSGYGPGGGGAGGGGSTIGNGGAGGAYGGGGGGGEGNGGNGKGGIIVITYTPANITVGTSGTQSSPMDSPSSNQYVGGAFTFINTGSTTVSQIIISETDGTLSANTYLTDVILKYKAEASCSVSIPGDARVFNATGVVFDGSDKATVVGDSPMSASTSQICVYVQLSVISGAGGNSFDIAISNPSTEVTVSAGTVSPATAVAIAGSTLLQTAVATISCSTDISTTAFGALTSASISTSAADATTSMTCVNSGAGCTMSIQDTGTSTGAISGLAAEAANAIIKSPNAAFSASTTLAAGTEGFGLLATTTSAGTGATLTIGTRYNNTGNWDANIVGGASTTAQTLATANSSTSARVVKVRHKAAISNTTPPGNYKDTIYYQCILN